MKQQKNRLLYLFLIAGWLVFSHWTMAQDTQIRGFANVDFYLQDNQLNFGFGDWDLFITSDLNDKFSFLGETVFKYSPSSSTHFSVGVERLIINFNYKGKHSVLVGKHHTPVNFWNDTDLDNDFNMIGNPYPSAIDIEKYFDANSSVIDPTIYLWTHTTAFSNDSGD